MKTEPVRDVARLRIQFLNYRNPQCWGLFYDGYWRFGCYAHAPTLEDAWVKAKEWSGSELYQTALENIRRIDARIADRLSAPPSSGDGT